MDAFPGVVLYVDNDISAMCLARTRVGIRNERLQRCPTPLLTRMSARLPTTVSR